MRPLLESYVLGEEMEPDFSKYNLEELQEIKEALDKDKYPEKYSRLLDELVWLPRDYVGLITERFCRK